MAGNTSASTPARTGPSVRLLLQSQVPPSSLQILQPSRRTYSCHPAQEVAATGSLHGALQGHRQRLAESLLSSPWASPCLCAGANSACTEHFIKAFHPHFETEVDLRSCTFSNLFRCPGIFMGSFKWANKGIAGASVTVSNLHHCEWQPGFHAVPVSWGCTTEPPAGTHAFCFPLPMEAGVPRKPNGHKGF